MQLSHRDMDLSEFLRSVGCWLYMACFEGFVDRRMWWSDMEVHMFEVALGRITKYISLLSFEDILRNLSYTDKNLPSYNDKFSHMYQMEYACNANMTKVFEPSWVSILIDSMQEWINKYTCNARMCVGRKPHHFGNERNTIACGLSRVMIFVEIVEGRDLPHERGNAEFDESGNTLGKMLG